MLVRSARRPDLRDKVAAIFERRDGREERATYAELNRRSNRIANALAAQRVAKGDRVAVLGRNSLEYVAIYFALAKLGAVMVPVNFWYRGAETRYTLDQSGSSLLLVAEPFAEAVEPVTVPRRIVYGPPEWERLLAAASDDEPAVSVDERDPHIILYTSGTTGFPKGATLSHRAHYLHALAWALQTGQRADDVGIVVYPLFHTGGPDCVVLPHFIVGGTIVIHDQAEADMMLVAIERRRLTNVFCVPTVWRRLLGHPSIAGRDLSSVRRCLGSSDTLPPDLLRELLARFDAEVWVTYGLTEAGCILTYSRLTRQDHHALASVGKPHPMAELKIVDQNDRELPLGQVGEIVARGPTLMDGYWAMPDRTAETMRGGWLHTGDLGRLDDEGNLHVVGRAKDMIISGGEKIYPLEVERLLRQHPAVRDCALVGVPDREWGESVLAVVVAETGHAITADEVSRYVRTRLAGYKTPRYVEFVDALPVTSATGKVQKELLRARYREQYSR
ncbi:MAG TPA: long-chain-fatty-acid--CoA ligase [Chloroflexota bacterium]|nr:long-chain-fatty-acid--CoA ligase [Chloroflexota bacterium]